MCIPHAAERIHGVGAGKLAFTAQFFHQRIQRVVLGVVGVDIGEMCIRDSNADMCKVLLCNNGDMAFVEKVKGIVEARIMNKWSTQFERAGYADKEYVFAFIVSGCMGMLQYWLENDMPLSPLEMAGMMESLSLIHISPVPPARTPAHTTRPALCCRLHSKRGPRWQIPPGYCAMQLPQPM